MNRDCAPKKGRISSVSRAEEAAGVLQSAPMKCGAASADVGFRDGATVFYLGEPCRLTVVHAVWNRVALEGDRLHVALGNVSNEALIRKRVEAWLLLQARQVLPGLFADVLARYGWRIRNARLPLVMQAAGQPDGIRLAVRRMRSRWGSCSMDGRIALSAELVQVPRRLAAYVVVHELCHLAHHNHAPAFWFQVATCLPDWRQRREALKQWQGGRRGAGGC
jgi:predicted metal-dependent hydrolase